VSKKHVKLFVAESTEPTDEVDGGDVYEYIDSQGRKNRYECNELLAQKIRNNEQSDSSEEEIENYLCTELVVSKKSKWYTRDIKQEPEKELIVIHKIKKPTIVLSAKNKLLNCLVDSGSDRCLIKYETIEALNSTDEIQKANVKVNGLNGTSQVTGEIELKIKVPGSSEKICCKALVLKNMNYPGNLILGRDLLESSNAVVDFGNSKISINGQDIEFSKNMRYESLVKDMKAENCLMANFVGAGKRKKEGERKLLNRNKNLKPEQKRSVRKTKGIVHLSCGITLKGGTLNTLYGHSKLMPGEYRVKKKCHKEGFVVAGSLCTVDEDGRIPLGVINMTSEDINLKDNTMLAEIEVMNDSEVYSVIVDDILQELRSSREINVYKKEEKAEVKKAAKDARKNIDKQTVSSTRSMDRNKSQPGGSKIPKADGFYLVAPKLSESLCVDNPQSNCEEILKVENKNDNDENIELKRDKSNENNEKIMSIKNKNDTDENFELKRNEDNENSSIKRDVDKIKLNFEELKLSTDASIGDEDTVNNLKKILNDFRDIVSIEGEGIGRTSLLTHKIRLKNPELIINTPSYRTPHKYQSLLDIELSRMKDQGIIEPSCSPFNSPVLAVKKKNGEIRPVIDYRNINKNVFIDSFALPRIDDILNSVGNAKVFSTIDLKSAFHHVSLEEDSKPITAFSAGNSKYQFRVLPFGLSSSPSVFQALMSRCLGEVLGKLAFCFIDDIIVFSNSVEEHFCHLRQVFSKLRSANLHMKLEKCQFLKTKVDYLGFVISSEGISYNKNSKIENANPPKDVKELQRFLGTCNYFRRFIEKFSDIAKPLYSLLKKNSEYIWSEDCEKAFQSLKAKLSKPPVLAHPNYSKPFFIFTDASADGIGACLMQTDDSSPSLMRPIIFFSKTLNKAQRRYSTTKKEALGLVTAVKQFQYIITGYPTIVLTDHRPLIYMFSKKLPADAAMARWCLTIQSFQLELKYFPGKQNVVADYLSRLPSQEIMRCETLIRNYGNDEVDEEESSEMDRTNSSSVDELDGDCDVFISTSERPLVKYLPKLEDVSWSLEELKKAQAEDSFTNTIMSYIKGSNEGHLPQSEINKYLIISGVLYKQRKIDNRQLEILNVVVPSKLMEKAINSIHYTMHNSNVHTLFKFSFRYFHPNEKKLIKEFCERCDVCKLLKGRFPKPVKLKSAPVPCRPFDAVSIDFVGPFQTTDNGNKYILSVIDLFSRFCILKALPSRATEGVIKTLREVFCQYGFPNTLLSDNALEFTSSAIHSFVKIYSLHKTEVLPFSAWSNGIVERQNAKIVKLLKLYANSINFNWDEYLDTTANTINNSLNETLGDTPAFTLFAYDTCPNVQRTELGAVYNYDSIESLCVLRERQAYRLAEEIKFNIMKEKAKQLHKINCHRKERSVACGDRVIIKNHNKKNKLELNFLGPGTVIESNNHKIKVKIGREIYDRVNINHVINLKGKAKSL